MERGSKQSKGNRGELDLKLGVVRGAMAANAAIEQAGYVMLGEGYLSAFDGEVSIHAYIETPLPKACVMAKPFMELVKRGAADQVELKMVGDQLHFKCGRTTATLPTKQLTHPFPVSMMNDLEWFDIPNGFLSALSVCASACSTDISDGLLTTVKTRGNELYGCDRFRLAHYALAVEPFAGWLYIPSSKVPLISKHEPDSLAVEQGMLHFLNKQGDCVSVATMTGTYPDAEKVLKQASTGPKLDLPTGPLADALGRVEILAQESAVGRQVAVTIENGELICTAQSQYGWVKEVVPCTYDGKLISFHVHAEHLKYILNSGVGGQVVNSETMLKFESEGLEYVVCKAIPLGAPQ